jgi:dipeptidyl aminopeptidase/acylaminoacyl peptidase
LPLLVILLAAVPAHSADLCGELAGRYAKDHLAIVQLFRNNSLEVIPFGKAAYYQPLGARRYLSVFFSADGSRILADSEVPDDDDKHYTYLLSPGGSMLGTAPSTYQMFVAALAPDGTRFAFHGDSDITVAKKWGVHIGFLDGRPPILVVPGSDMETPRKRSIGWSPDSRYLVYDWNKRVSRYEIATSKVSTVADGSDPTWSPDGKWIAYRSPSNEAVLIDPAGGAPKYPLKQRKILGPLRWSPDGKYFFFAEEFHHARWLGPLGWNPGSRLVVARLEDGATCAVYDSPDPDNMITGRDFGWLYLEPRQVR